MQFYQRLMVTVSKWAMYTGAVFLMGLMFYVTLDIAGRYLLNRPLPDSNTISGYMQVALVFLGMAYAQFKKANVRVDLNLMHPRPQSIVNAIMLVPVFVLFSFMAWEDWSSFLESLKLGEKVYGVMDIPTTPARFVMALGMSLFCLYLIADFFQEIYLARKAPHKKTAGPEEASTS